MNGKKRNHNFLNLNNAVVMIMIAIIYFTSARLSLFLAVGDTNASPVWPPSGIALAIILLLGYRVGPAIFAGAFIANLFTLKGYGFSDALYVTASFSTAIGNMLEGLIGVYLIRLFSKTDNPFETIKDLSVFIIFGSLISTLLSPTIGVASFCFISGKWFLFNTIWMTWWLGDAAGILIFSPVIILLMKKVPWKIPEIDIFEEILIFLILTISSLIIFYNNYHLQYVIIPLLLWIALRFGRVYSASAIILVSGIAIICAVNNAAASGNINPDRLLLFIQTYIGVISIITLCLSVLAHERRISDQSRARVQKELYDIIELLPDATFAIDKNGMITTWNKAIEVLTGKSKEEMIGKASREYSLPFYGKRIPLLIDIVMNNSDISDPERYDYIRKGGDTLFAESYNPPMDRFLACAASKLVDSDGNDYGAIETIRDITDRKTAERDLKHYKEHLEDLVEERNAELVKLNEQLLLRIEDKENAEKALAESEKKYRDLVESANSIIMRWKPDGTVTFFNTFAQKFFCYTLPEIIGRNIIGTIVPAMETSGRDLEMLIHEIGQNTETHLFNENENIKKNGEKVWIAWTNKSIHDDNGNVTEILSVGNDITLRKSIEESLKRALEELSVEKERAEAADRAKSAFLASMTHEIRTPLNAILGYSQILLRDKELPDESLHQIEIINSSGEHLLGLINEILDMSKIESGRTEIYNETFSLFAEMKQVENLFSIKTGRKGIDYRININDGVPDIIETDRSKLRQVIINLIGNAVKLTDRGSIKVDISVSAEDHEVLIISVTDTGKGIPGGYLEKIFAPFEQTDEGRDRGGTGLGLHISRKFANMLGGNITVQSVYGEGSCFTFTLRYRKGSVIEQTEIAEERKISGIKSTRMPRILIVDDKDVNRDILIKMLSPLGFILHEATGGREAMALIDTWRPDLILLDLIMPEFSGRDIIKTLKDKPGYDDIKIIVVTASALEMEKKKILELGADAFVRKPFREALILNEIKEILGLEYVYEEEKNNSTDLPVFTTASELAVNAGIIPEDIRMQLKNSLITGDIEEINNSIRKIAGVNENLARAIKYMTDDFEFSTLIEILNTRIDT